MQVSGITIPHFGVNPYAGSKMRLSMSTTCRQVPPLVNFQGRLNLESFFHQKDKVIFVIGATGTGKSRLAIDLANQIPAEIVNSDKIQAYKGLDIVTNKVTEEECRGVPHHLIGTIDQNSSFTSTDFRSQASLAVESIVGRGRFPIIAGGSNSYIDALVNEDPQFRSWYECCFLWVDVSLPVLNSFLSERVEKMVKAGMVDEVRKMFKPNADYSRGIRRAIGVQEMHEYLRNEKIVDDEVRARLLEAAIAKIEENTRTLASKQTQKIHRLHNQWRRKMHRIDATEVFLKRGEEAEEAWDRLVVRPSTMIVEQFLDEEYLRTIVSPDNVAAMTAISAATSVPEAVAAASL